MPQTETDKSSEQLLEEARDFLTKTARADLTIGENHPEFPSVNDGLLYTTRDSDGIERFLLVFRGQQSINNNGTSQTSEQYTVIACNDNPLTTEQPTVFAAATYTYPLPSPKGKLSNAHHPSLEGVTANLGLPLSVQDGIGNIYRGVLSTDQDATIAGRQARLLSPLLQHSPKLIGRITVHAPHMPIAGTEYQTRRSA